MGELFNTMQGSMVGPPVPPEIELQQFMEQLHAQSQTANASASSAQQAYQQGLPLPGPPPAAALIPLLGAALSSIGSGNQAHIQGAQEALKSNRAELMQKREENLRALHDSYEQQVAAAKQINNFEAEIKARVSMDKVAKSMEQLHQTKQQEFEAGQNAAQHGVTMRGQDIARRGQDMQLKEAQIRAAGDASAKQLLNDSVMQQQVTQTDFGSYFNISEFKDKDSRNLALRFAADNKLVPLSEKQVATVNGVQQAYNTYLDQLEQIKPLLADTPGDRVLNSPKLWLQATTQTNATAGAFKAFWSNAIRTARASIGEGSGFRFNEREIQRSLKYDQPSLYDTKAVAEQKAANVKIILGNVVEPYFSRDLRRQKDSVKFDSQAGDKMTIMGPNGVQILSVKKAEELLKQPGYVRVLTSANDPDPLKLGN